MLLIIASVIMNSNPEDGWAATLGTPILEASVIYFILRMLYIKESDEIRIQRLEEANKKLKRSAVKGLADGYYTNFVKKVGLIL